jgi:NAD(P)H-dependent FMN reductase
MTTTNIIEEKIRKKLEYMEMREVNTQVFKFFRLEEKQNKKSDNITKDTTDKENIKEFFKESIMTLALYKYQNCTHVSLVHI